jgi:hypothetical protein
MAKQNLHYIFINITTILRQCYRNIAGKYLTGYIYIYCNNIKTIFLQLHHGNISYNVAKCYANIGTIFFCYLGKNKNNVMKTVRLKRIPVTSGRCFYEKLIKKVFFQTVNMNRFFLIFEALELFCCDEIQQFCQNIL